MSKLDLIMTQFVVPLLFVGCIIAAIVVVVWHFTKPKQQATGQHTAPGPYAPRVADGTCLRCGMMCDGYDMSIPGQPQRIHWQHRQPPADMHLAAIVTAYAQPGFTLEQVGELSELPTMTDPWPQETATPTGQHRAEAH